MFRPYVQDTADWIKYYDSNSKSNKDSGEASGGIGAESGSIANPVEKAVSNNLKTINDKMRSGELSSSLPSDQVVAQAIAKTVRRRKRRKKSSRRTGGAKRRNVKKKRQRTKKVSKRRKGKKKVVGKKRKRKRKKRSVRDLFDP